MEANKEELNYLNVMRLILENGEERQDRTGTGTKSIFGTRLKFSLTDNTLPLLTTKKMYWKGVVEELLFFIRGETDTKKLEAQGVNIWKGNTSREFLDSRGLQHLSEGDMGKGYGYQWRKFGALDGTEPGSDDDYKGPGVDQLADVVKSIKEDPNSRRHIVSAWNPQQLNDTSLPPCHLLYQFYVSGKDLSCQFYMRSVDYLLGLPFNIASYSLLTHLIAKLTGLQAKEVIFVGGDTHIYLTHTEQAKEQLQRKPYAFSKLTIKKELKSLSDVETLQFEDLELIGYTSHPAIKATMAI